MKTKLISIFFTFILFSTTYLPIGFSQDYTTWNLPEGAKARLGKGTIWDAQFSPNSEYLAVAGTIGIWLYDTLGYKERSLLVGHTADVICVAFSPNSQMLASGSVDGTVRLWNVETNQLQQTLVGHRGPVESVAFSPNGRRLASGSIDATVRVWEVSPSGDRTTWTANHKLTLVDHTAMVTGVAFSPDSQTLVSSSYDNTVRVWNPVTGVLKNTLTRIWKSIDGYIDAAESVAFSPDGKVLASVGYHGGIITWDTETWELQPEQGSSFGGPCLAFSPNGRQLAAGSFLCPVNYEALVLYDEVGIVGWGDRLMFDDTWYSAWSASFSPNGGTLAIVYSDATIRLWNTETRELRHTITGHTQPMTSVDFSPDGTILANGSGDMYHKGRRFSNNYIENNTVHLWDMETGTLQRTIVTDVSLVLSVKFAPNGKTLAHGGPDGIRLWNVQTGALQYSASGHITSDWSSISSVAFSPWPANQWLAAGGSGSGETAGGIIQLWHFPRVGFDTPVLWDTIQEDIREVHSVAFTPNIDIQYGVLRYKFVVGANSNGTIRPWFFSAILGIPPYLLDVPLASLGPGRSVHFHEAFRSESGEFTSVAFNHRPGTRDTWSLVGGALNGDIYVWYMPDQDDGPWPPERLGGLLRYILKGHAHFVRSLTFGPDGRTLASGSADETVRLWDIDTGTHKRTLSGHTAEVTGVAFSPDGQTLASGSADGTVLLWKVD